MFLLTYSSAVLCAVFIITGAVSGEEVKKAVGETVSFRPDKLGSPVTSFTWKQINGGKVVKAIEWDDEGLNIPKPRFQNITTLDNKTGQITITNLQVEHSGLYTIDINSKEQQQTFTLTVMERVPKPVITIEMGNDPDVYLKCGYNETIIWKNSAGDTVQGKKNHNPGEFITVTNTRHPDNFYTCTFKNAVSEETSDRVYERDLFIERVPKPVITIEKNSNPDVVYLRCEYSETIIWKNSAGDTVEGKKNHNPGEFITVKNTRNPENFYRCTLKNAVSEETSDPVYERDIFVTEPVPKPVITIEKSSNPDVVYLRCGYSGTIIWKNSAGDTLQGTKNHNPGEFITVTNTRNPEYFYTCTLKNAVSEEISDPVYERNIFVIEPAPKPVITIEKSSNPDVVYLRCGYSGTIIWKNSAGDTLKGTKNHNPGEFITVKNTRNPGNFYTCTLKNAVSEEISDPVYERDLFIERVPKPVITIEKSSNPDVYLKCGYSETIIWKNSAGDTLEGTKNHTPGEFITVTNTINPGNFYTCTLKNAVSEETSDPVYERDLFKE